MARWQVNEPPVRAEPCARRGLARRGHHADPGERHAELVAHRGSVPGVVRVTVRREHRDRLQVERADHGHGLPRGTRTRVDEISIGDYVLGGGEAAALVVLEAVVRLLPGVVGNAESLVEESHAIGLLEGPAYTKPPTWRGLDVPEVLMSGNHAAIARFRHEQSLTRTARRRPDLLARGGQEPIRPVDEAVAD